MALIYNATFDSQTRVLSLLDKAGNVISSCEVPSKELVDDPNKPLMLRAIEDNSSVTLQNNGTLSNTYQTSTNGTDWTDYTLGTQISLNKGESVYFRCSNHPTTQSASNFVQFVMTGKIEAWHNAYSMISSDFSSAEGSVGDYGMCGLFKDCASITKAPLLVNALASCCYWSMFYGCTALTQAPSLPATALASNCYQAMFGGCSALTQAPSLPATALADNCYQTMFYGCTALTQAPSLPATYLAYFCYAYMFYGCTSLTQAPSLPAMKLAIYCYSDMFHDCTALTQAPSLPAMTLASHCYSEMFRGCTALTQAPSLPATALASNCYEYMFSGCTALTQAPSLPAMALSNFCYQYMFSGCTSLTQAPSLPATALADYCYSYMFRDCSKLAEVRIAATTKETGALDSWLTGVASTGDFYCDPNATIFPKGVSGIPSGWTRHALSDYPTT